MLRNKYNVSVKDCFRHKNKKKGLQDPTNDFSFIPSLNKEFVSLIGLEEVVQFRLDRLDKTVYTPPNKHKTRGKQKKLPLPAVVSATLRKDPYTCVKCNTDVSSSWKHDVNSSILCLSCFKCSRRKDHRLSSAPRETVIRSVSDNSYILTSSSQPVWNDPQSMKESVFVLQNFSHLIPQESDQQVSENSLSSSTNFRADSPFCCSSPLSSDLSSSPSTFCISSSSYGSSLSDSSSLSYFSSCSNLNSSSSSPSGSPPTNSGTCISQKVKTPYWVETPRLSLKTRKMRKKRNKSQCREGKTRKTAALSVPSSSSNQRILPKTKSALPDSVPSSSPLLSGSKQFQTPNLQKNTGVEKNKLTIEEGLVPGHGNLQKVSTNVLHGYVSGSSLYSSDSGKSTICYQRKTPSAVMDNIIQQDLRLTPRRFGDNKKMSIMKVEKFGSKVQHQGSHAHPSSSQINSAPIQKSFLSQMDLSTNQKKTKLQKKVKWQAAPKQKIEKWSQKPEPPMGSHGRYPSCSSSTSSSLVSMRK